MIFDDCNVQDGGCLPRCDCDVGYLGSSCTSSPEFVELMNLGHLIVEKVGELMVVENTWERNVKSWVRILSLLTSDQESLILDSKILMTSLSIQILTLSREIGISIEDLSSAGISEVVDMCFSALSSSSPDQDVMDEVKTSLFTLLRVYNDFISSDIVWDQNPVSLITPNFRSTSYALTRPVSSLSIPESDLELLQSNSFQDQTQQSIELLSGFRYPLFISISEPLLQSTSSSRLANSRRLEMNESASASALSLPLVVTLNSSPCTIDQVGCLVKVILLNKLQLANSNTSSISQSSPSPPRIF